MGVFSALIGKFSPVLRIRIGIRDAVLFSHWIQDGKIFRARIRDRGLKFFDADPDPGSGI
jgi:hypothetical protein